MPITLYPAGFEIKDDGTYVGIAAFQGPEGEQGETGATGPAGHGLEIKGIVASTSNLPTASEHAWEMYGVGAEEPYTYYLSDGTEWTSLGTFQGPTGETGATGATGPQGPTGETGPKGDTGTPAGFGSITATVDGSSGTPSVTVTTSGTDAAKNISFAFSGLKGEGISGGEFTPAIYIGPAEPATPSNNLLWIENESIITAGDLQIGVSSSLPSTNSSGGVLVSGDVYIWNAYPNNHPVSWGSVKVCPFKVYLHDGTEWVFKDSEVYVDDDWWVNGVEWIIENGNVVGSVSYVSAGSVYFTHTKENDYAVFTSTSTNTSARYMELVLGQGASGGVQTYPFDWGMECDVLNSSYTTGKIGLYSGSPQVTTNAPTVYNSTVISAGGRYTGLFTGDTDGLQNYTNISPCIMVGVISGNTSAVIKIKNAWKKWTGTIPT